MISGLITNGIHPAVMLYAVIICYYSLHLTIQPLPGKHLSDSLIMKGLRSNEIRGKWRFLRYMTFTTHFLRQDIYSWLLL